MQKWCLQTIVRPNQSGCRPQKLWSQLSGCVLILLPYRLSSYLKISRKRYRIGKIRLPPWKQARMHIYNFKVVQLANVYKWCCSHRCFFSILNWSYRFVLQLAIADSIFLALLPFLAVEDLKGKWNFSSTMCKAFHGIFMLNYYAGIFFLTVICQNLIYHIW